MTLKKLIKNDLLSGSIEYLFIVIRDEDSCKDILSKNVLCLKNGKPQFDNDKMLYKCYKRYNITKIGAYEDYAHIFGELTNGNGLYIVLKAPKDMRDYCDIWDKANNQPIVLSHETGKPVSTNGEEMGLN